MRITSTAFENNGIIPEDFSCDGNDISPPLKFEDIPEETVSLALIVSDPDAPGKPFYHWILFNMDPETSHIDEDSIPSSAIQGKNDGYQLEYLGPCPPSDKHRYIFKLYALENILNLEEGVKGQEIEQEMEGNILETAKLTGIYGKD